ncbi:arsenic metallochaperone ArsD family protein [Bacillus sp. 3103sda1]
MYEPAMCCLAGVCGVSIDQKIIS